MAVSELAGRQFGVVSREQLHQIGMKEGGIERRLRSGRLHPLHPGVYAVGHRSVSREGLWLAALLWGGEDAVLSHRSAAELWGVLEIDRSKRIEISAPPETRSRTSIRRRYTQLAPDEVTERSGLPVTTLSRTLMDLGSAIPGRRLERAVREAEYLHRYDPRDLWRMLGRHPGQRGTRAIRTCLENIGLGPRGRTRSDLEVLFASVLARSSLPRAELNVTIEVAGRLVEADCLWRRQRVIVELDGGQSHGTWSASESDRKRDRQLQADGWRIIRVTWRQLDEPEEVIADLAKVLSQAEIASTVARGR